MPAGLQTLVDRLRGAVRRDALASATDADLLRRFADQRDEVAFAELVHRHAPAVYALCRRHLTRPADLDDAFQATFVVLAQKAGTVAKPDKLSAWLCGVADRVARKARARAAKRAGKEQPLGGIDPAAATPDPETDLRAVLDDELRQLPAEYRAAVLLCDVDGVSRREAAKRLGIPDGTLSNRLARARAMLGRRLLRRGVALGAGLALSSAASAAVPARLVALAVSQISGSAVPPEILSLASVGVTPVITIRPVLAVLLAGVCAAGMSVLSVSAREPVKAPPPKVTPSPEPVDPEPEEVKGYSQVSASAYSRDGKGLAIVRSDLQVVKVYDTATWKVLHTIALGKEMCFAVQFSADGGTLYAAGMDGPIRTWDTKTGKAGPTLDAKAGRCFGLVLSPDGQRLASGHDDPDAGKSSIQLWDIKAGKVERMLACDEYLLSNTITFSPDGKTVAGGYHASHKKNPDAAGFHGVIEWDAATGKEAKRFDTPRVTPGAHPVAHAIAYTPDGKKLILGGGEAVPIPGQQGSTMLYGYLWVIDRKSGEVEKTLVSNRNDYIRTLATSPDGGKLYVPADSLAARALPRGVNPNNVNPVHEFQCWDTATWETDWVVTSGTPLGVSKIAVSPGGKRVGLTGTNGFHLLDANTGDPKGGLVTFVRPR